MQSDVVHLALDGAAILSGGRGASRAKVVCGGQPASAGMEQILRLANPWSLPLPLWIAAVVAKETMLQCLDAAVGRIAARIEPLPSRKGPKPLPQRPLDRTDLAYLACNACIETAFVGHLLRHALYGEGVDRSLSSLGLLNGPAALWLLIVSNDMLYAPFHRALHHPRLYAWIHKHHHRVTYPQRGRVLEKALGVVLASQKCASESDQLGGSSRLLPQKGGAFPDPSRATILCCTPR